MGLTNTTCLAETRAMKNFAQVDTFAWGQPTATPRPHWQSRQFSYDFASDGIDVAFDPVRESGDGVAIFAPFDRSGSGVPTNSQEQSDFLFSRGVQPLQNDPDGLYSMQKHEPHKCSSTTRWYLGDGAGTMPKYIYQSIYSSTCIKGTLDYNGGLKRKMYDAWLTVHIKCGIPKTGCGAKDCGCAPPVRQMFYIRNWESMETDCMNSSTDNDLKKTYRRIAFHELLHVAGKGHSIITTCTASCKGSSALNLPSFDAGDDGYTPAAACSDSGK